MACNLVALNLDAVNRFVAAIKRYGVGRCAVVAAVLSLGMVNAASAYEVFDNGKLRFGTGSEASVNANGNFQQPFYYDTTLSQWYKLTYSSYPLDNAIGIDGDGTNEWNINGSVVQNSALTGQVLDVSGFSLTTGSKGYGTIVSTGTVTIASKTLEFKNTYELGQNNAFVKITTRVTNTSGSDISNVRVWVGTRDDWVGTSDSPTKQRGNLVSGAFAAIAAATDRSAALEITSGATGVLFYSTSPKANTAINNCCSFSRAYNQNPATSNISRTNDGSYALFVRMSDLAIGASEAFTWYYAAGPVADLAAIAGDVAQDQQNSNIAVTASAGTGGTISPGTISVASGATTAFSITPATGYNIADVSGCGGALIGTTFTTAPITGACAVTASFALNTYIVNASAGTGGSISPNNATVNYNATTSFTVTPNAGYSIDAVQGCGGALSNTTFTTGSITNACAITASFTANQYTVTAAASEGGSVSSGSKQALYGDITTFEITAATGYRIASVTGCGGVLSGSTYSTAAISAACTITATFALAVPTFAPAQPPMLEMNATQLFSVRPSIKPQAYDFSGTELAVVLVNEQVRYEPGDHVLTWRAVDSRGVSVTVQQTLRIWPTVSFGPDITIGGKAGNSDIFRIALNGPSPVYPFTVNYVASGDLQGHDLQSGAVVFNQGVLEKEIPFAILSTLPVGAADKHVQLTFADGVNRDSAKPLTVTLTALNSAPIATIEISQNGEHRPSVARSDGPITIDASIHDPDSSDTHTIQWIGPSGAVFTVNNGQLVLQPGSLSAGVHRFELVITDSGSPPQVTHSTFDLVVRENAQVLPSGATAWLANGLPNDPSYAAVAPNTLPERTQELTHHLMETEAGTQLALGPYAILRGSYQTELQGTMTSIAIPTDSVVNISGYFDFVIADLPRPGESVSIAIPQRAMIPPQPVYRKFDTAGGRWQTFVEDVNNVLASAPGQEGFCPSPSSSEYRAGLHTGDWCVRLTIRDGGPNDSDGQVNGSVSDPGGIGSLTTVVVTGEAKGSSGGGALNSWLLFSMSALLLMQAIRRQRRWLVCTVFAALCANAAAAEPAHWYGGASVAQARSDVNASDVTQRLQQQGYAVTANASDENRFAWRAYGGYQWTRYVSAEIGYVELGNVTTSYSGNVADVSQFLLDANKLQPPSAQGVDLAMVAHYDLGAHFSVQARAGIFVWDAAFRTSNIAGQAVRRNESGADALVGVGAELSMSRHWSANAQYTRYSVSGDHIEFIAAGIAYRWR